jgi:demethylmenaquinone methyltransferase/2-methoxy-6-polyprenyl-1,4-benzoquinol methylase
MRVTDPNAARRRPSSLWATSAKRVPVSLGFLGLCTGTATVLPFLQAKVGPSGRVVGVDFSRGMLNVGHAKTRDVANIHLVEAEAERLPFARGTFDAVT